MAKEENPLTAMLADLGENAKKVVPTLQKAIEEEAQAVYRSMRDNTPVGEGKGGVHLKDTLQIKPTTNPRKWGFKIDYEGYRDENGVQVPFSMIARALNKGGKDGSYAPTHHIDNAVRLLKGMDGRLAKKAEEALSEGVDE